MPLQPRRVHPPSAPALDRRGGRLQTPSRRRRVIGNYEAARTAVREIADATGMTPPELFLGERALGGGTVLPLENAYKFETNLLVVCCYRMARRSELIAKAEECARLAQASDEAGVKYRYMIAADEWREMAEEKRFPKKRSSLFHRRGHKRHQPSARTS